MNKNKGSMLLVVIILSAVIMMSTAAFSTQSVLLSRSSLDQLQSNQAGAIASSLIADTIQQYMRFGYELTNPYSDWSSNCLQEDDWLCKIDLSLDGAGGTIDAWGQYGQKIKHLRAEISVLGNNRILINSIQEVIE